MEAVDARIPQFTSRVFYLSQVAQQIRDTAEYFEMQENLTHNTHFYSELRNQDRHILACYKELHQEQIAVCRDLALVLISEATIKLAEAFLQNQPVK